MLASHQVGMLWYGSGHTAHQSSALLAVGALLQATLSCTLQAGLFALAAHNAVSKDSILIIIDMCYSCAQQKQVSAPSTVSSRLLTSDAQPALLQG